MRWGGGGGGGGGVWVGGGGGGGGGWGGGWHKWNIFFAAFGGDGEKFKLFSRVFITKSAEKRGFSANFSKKSKKFLKIVAKSAIFNLSKKISLPKGRTPGGGVDFRTPGGGGHNSNPPPLHTYAWST